MRLKDKVALITGASSGIGKATLERFLQEGAKVVANDISETGNALCDKWKRQGYDVEFYKLDVSRIDELPNMVAFTEERYGKLDILINNVGIEFARSILEMTLEDWRKLQEINLESMVFLTQAAARSMKRVNYGRIVNMASIQGMFGTMNNAHYAASKAAIIQLTRSSAIELADSNIMVNGIAPGVIHTPMSVMGGVDETETEEFQYIYIKHGKIPLRRPGKPEEVASTIAFLASDDCQYMTGQTLVVDGGLSTVW